MWAADSSRCSLKGKSFGRPLVRIDKSQWPIGSTSIQKNHSKKLALLSAKSWILRNKLYAALHDPYIYTLNEVENTDVFDDIDGEDQSAIDNLFDDEPVEKMVEVVMLKNTTVNSKKLLKDTILEVTEQNAKKLIDDKKAKLNTPDPKDNE